MPLPHVPAVDDVYELVVKARRAVQNESILNVLHYKVEVAGSSEVQIVTTLAAVWTAQVMPRLHTNYVGIECELKRILTAVQQPPTPTNAHPTKTIYDFGSFAPMPGTGILVGPCLPLYVTMSFRYRTNILGRYWRGGVRLSPIPEGVRDLVDQEKWDALSLGNLETNLSNLLLPGPIPGGGVIRQVIFSPTWLAWVAAPGTLPIAATAPIQQIQGNIYMRSQNSRQAPHVP
jgi:hypothetical protein